jgi:ABC-type dipeptide/oligopeptide/nickel transport system ATPase subunit
MSEHMAVIEARNLSVFHFSGVMFSRKHYCVRNLTFHIHKNEIIGLAGPSGSGKTSLGKALLGLIPTWDGDVYWNGLNTRSGVTREQRRRFGWIGQESTLAFNPSRKIISVLRETLAVNGIVDSGLLLEKMCKRMHLDPELLERRPFELSGGQVQRCALMRVLMLGPEFLLLDEPTSSLDTVNQKEIIRLLLDWKDEHGLSMLFISHSKALLGKICNRIMILENGND